MQMAQCRSSLAPSLPPRKRPPGGPFEIRNLDPQQAPGREPRRPGCHQGHRLRAGEMLEDVVQPHFLHRGKRMAQSRDIGIEIGHTLGLHRVLAGRKIDVQIAIEPVLPTTEMKFHCQPPIYL